MSLIVIIDEHHRGRGFNRIQFKTVFAHGFLFGGLGLDLCIH